MGACPVQSVMSRPKNPQADASMFGRKASHHMGDTPFSRCSQENPFHHHWRTPEARTLASETRMASDPSQPVMSLHTRWPTLPPGWTLLTNVAKYRIVERVNQCCRGLRRDRTVQDRHDRTSQRLGGRARAFETEGCTSRTNSLHRAFFATWLLFSGSPLLGSTSSKDWAAPQCIAPLWSWEDLCVFKSPCKVDTLVRALFTNSRGVQRAVLWH